MQELQQRLNLQYLTSNAAARAEKWSLLESNEDRAEMDPARFLREEFVEAAEEASKDKMIVLKRMQNPARAQVHQAAELLGLQHSSTTAPINQALVIGLQSDGWS